jgi:hypothetical protein
MLVDEDFYTCKFQMIRQISFGKGTDPSDGALAIYDQRDSGCPYFRGSKKCVSLLYYANTGADAFNFLPAANPVAAGLA